MPGSPSFRAKVIRGTLGAGSMTVRAGTMDIGLQMVFSKTDEARNQVAE